MKYCFKHKKIKLVSPRTVNCVNFCTNSHKKVRSDVIKVLTGEDVEKCHSGSGYGFVWISSVVQFPVKHLCLYNNALSLLFC